MSHKRLVAIDGERQMKEIYKRERNEVKKQRDEARASAEQWGRLLARAQGRLAKMRKFLKERDCQYGPETKCSSCMFCNETASKACAYAPLHIFLWDTPEPGKPEADVIVAARPFMEAVPLWDCNEDEPVTVVVTARETAALCQAFDAMDQEGGD